VLQTNRGGKLARFGIDVFEANREMEVVTAETIRLMLRRPPRRGQLGSTSAAIDICTDIAQDSSR
jgi:hypothetical protein